MAWIEKIKTDLSLKFGDGNTYTPKWVNATKKYESNYTEFIFKGLSGSFVDRRLPRGTRYELELYFDATAINGVSQDNLDLSDAFFKSSIYNDGIKSPSITLVHPFYGQLQVQSLGWEFDNTDLNVTKISGTVIETLQEFGLAYPESKPDVIQAKAQAVIRTFSDTYNRVVAIPSAQDILSQSQSANAVIDSETGFIILQSDLDKLQNAYNAANGFIAMGEAAINQGINTFGYLAYLATLPATFAMTVVNRIAFLTACINNLTFNSLLSTTQKLLWEEMAGLFQSSMYVSSVTGITNDYKNANDVISVADGLIAQYNAYMANLDTLQTATGGQLNSYFPDPANIQAITDIFLYTINALYDIAANSKKQYTVYLPQDSDIITVAYQYLGLQPDDSTIDAIINLNNLTLDEFITLPKGRAITYYA